MPVLHYFHTLRHLRPVQVWSRLWHLLPRRGLDPSPGGAFRGPPAGWVTPPAKPPSLRGPCRLRFLNVERELRSAEDWNGPDLDRLWLYNLHYFDALGGGGWNADSAWAQELLKRWIQENPPGHGTGWEPYPVSLRVVNWTKWLWEGNRMVPGMTESLAVQGRWLASRLERHLLGNHLLANAKALCFLGRCFDGDEARRWSATGWRLLEKQVAEQFLPDGGHCELSPMYHAIMVEDLLDLLNLCGGGGEAEAPGWLRSVAARSLGWLHSLDYDGSGPPLLNDATGGIAPDTADLAEYASQVGVAEDDSRLDRLGFAHGWSGRGHSGYWSLCGGPLRLLFDAAPLGPDYQPGHAHGDMLAVHCWLDGRPVLTDTGVTTYAPGPRRSYARSSAAHNTVVLDGLDQAEFWAAFRVARRGHPHRFEAFADGVACGHDGFRRQGRKLDHYRRVHLRDLGFHVVDELEGPGRHHFEAYWHFAPGTDIRRLDATRFLVNNRLACEVRGGTCVWRPSEFYPGFGLVETRPSLAVRGDFHGRHKVELSCLIQA